MNSVFLLWHIRKLPDGEEDSKLLGVYSNRNIATKKIENIYKKLPGFSETNGEFLIDEYDIDKDHWVGGFITA